MPCPSHQVCAGESFKVQMLCQGSFSCNALYLKQINFDIKGVCKERFMRTPKHFVKFHALGADLARDLEET